MANEVSFTRLKIPPVRFTWHSHLEIDIMENYLKTNIQFLKAALYDDHIDRVLFLLTIIFFITNYFVWSKNLSSPELFIYLRISIYPIKLLAIMLLVNTLLAIFAHTKEKEIGYFLFISNILLNVLVFILETFYLLNK